MTANHYLMIALGINAVLIGLFVWNAFKKGTDFTRGRMHVRSMLADGVRVHDVRHEAETSFDSFHLGMRAELNQKGYL